MTYSRETTNMIVECWGKGLSAEETRVFITKKMSVTVGLATVYRHRHSITAQNIIDELIRQQLRDIALSSSDTARMKYRDRLLNKLIPQRVETLSYEKIEETIKIDATDDEDEILSKAAAILTRKEKHTSIH